MPGTFIVIEGPDGAGTTLHSGLLADALRAVGQDVVLTAEPTKGPIGTFVRSKLAKEESLSPLALQTLFTADRAWHTESDILPALAQGKTVISDRYVPSTIIYGKALDVPKDMLEEMNNYFVRPDHLFLLLPPYDVCAERLSRRQEKDRMETDELQRKVYAGYERFAKEHPEAIVIDTSGEKNVVAHNIATCVL